MIATLTDENIHHKVVGVLLNLVMDKRFEITPYTSAMRGIGEHRNQIVKDFLDTDCDYLLMVDSDNPPPMNVLDLVELDKDVIGLPTPINMEWQQGIPDVRWNVFGDDDLPVKETGEGLQEVNMVGSGVILIARRVLEKVKHPFTEIRNEDGLRIVGTDAAFCKRAKNAGFKIWTNWDYTCRHFKCVDLKLWANS